jgi:hypothetical protein
VIVCTRYLRRGLRACLRAGIDLHEISRGTAFSAPQLRSVLDGQYTWTTAGSASMLLDALPPSVRRAVEEPTFALALDTRTGCLPSRLLIPVIQRMVDRHGQKTTFILLGVSWTRGQGILQGEDTVRFALADGILTRADEALRWHSDPELRRAYWSYADSRRCLVAGNRPAPVWRRKPRPRPVAA